MGKYEFKLEPYDHQREALKSTWNSPIAALLMEYGTGKTKVILDNVGILYEHPAYDVEALLVVAPNSVHVQWVEEQVPDHLPDRIKHVSRYWKPNNTKKFKKTLEDYWAPKYKNHLKIFTVNVEALASSKRAQNFILHFMKAFKTFLVMDESTRIKTPSAKTTKFAMKMAKLAEWRRTLTGNEVTRVPFDVYAPYKFLDVDFWGGMSFQVFQHRYGKWKTNYRHAKTIKAKYKCPHCHRFTTLEVTRVAGIAVCKCGLCNKICRDRLPWKAKQVIQNDGKFEYPTLIGYKNMPELRERTGKIAFIARKEDCLDLPEKVYQPVYAELNAEQKRIYKELKQTLYTEYNDTELTVANKIALSVRFQQIVGGFFPETGEPIGPKNPKLTALIYDLDDISCPDPIIIWSRFTAEIEAIAEAIQKKYVDKRVVTYYGATKKSERAQIIKDFKKGEIDFFIANPASAGTGLNLQNAYIQYYYSNSFKAEDRWQSEDRTHRNGQTQTCLYKDIFIKGTIDDSVKRSSELKMDMAEFFKNKDIKDLV